MDHESELTSDAIIAIGACRPDSDDGNFPEVASALAGQSSQRVAACRRSVATFDQAVSRAMRQVIVPDGLQERILASLPASVEVASNGVDCEAERAATHRPPRRLVLAVTGLAMAASVLLAVAFWASRETLDATDVQAQARAFYESDDHRAELTAPSSSTALPISPHTVLGRRDMTFLERSGSAYELDVVVRRRHVKGTLYVVPLGSLWGPKLTDLRGSPLPLGTSGVTIAAWTVGADAYVMVVQGDEHAFWSFFSQKLA
jgi:hypothetical protein